MNLALDLIHFLRVTILDILTQLGGDAVAENPVRRELLFEIRQEKRYELWVQRFPLFVLVEVVVLFEVVHRYTFWATLIIS